jgi:lipooligosaccharide transport system permease protein
MADAVETQAVAGSPAGVAPRGGRGVRSGETGAAAPPVGRRLWLRAFEYWVYQYKRTWSANAVSTVLNPVIFLAAMGLGLGTLVDRSRSGGVDGVAYLVFLAPGLLAATAMQIGVTESTYPVLTAIKWVKTYLAMLATPLGVTDVLIGHLLWIVVRVFSGCTVYLAVMAAFGAVRSPLALLAVPAGLLTGLAFVTPLMAYAAARKSEQGFAAVFRFVVTPLFLFSGTFFPVSQLPWPLETFAYLTPLWRGVDLCRTLTLGTATAGTTIVHIGYLAAWVGAGAWASVWAYRRALVV